ncbi:MAG: YbjN domain-containing protein [Acidimicrobiia bacterium]
MADRAGVEELLRTAIERWLADPDSDVEYAERLEGRWAVRMRQSVRDATTVWWEVGDRSLRFEAYVLPAPERNREEVFAQCLRRNAVSWRSRFALDREDGIVLRGRIALEQVTVLELDLALGEVYGTVEVAFRPLIRTAFHRENSR